MSMPQSCGQSTCGTNSDEKASALACTGVPPELLHAALLSLILASANIRIAREYALTAAALQHPFGSITASVHTAVCAYTCLLRDL